MLRRTALLFFTLALLCPASTFADSVTGFESGIPAGWTVSGVAGTATAASGLPPTQGTSFGYVANTGLLQAYLLSPVLSFNGQQALVLSANYLAMDSGKYNDPASILLIPVGTTFQPMAVHGGTVLHPSTTTATLFSASATCEWAPVLGQVSPGVLLNQSAVNFSGTTVTLGSTVISGTGDYHFCFPIPDGATGIVRGSTEWVTSSYVPLAGEYQLFIQIQNAIDTGSEAALAVDNIRIVAVPEPSSILFLSVGFVGVWLRRRRSESPFTRVE